MIVRHAHQHRYNRVVFTSSRSFRSFLDTIPDSFQPNRTDNTLLVLIIQNLPSLAHGFSGFPPNAMFFMVVDTLSALL